MMMQLFIHSARLSGINVTRGCQPHDPYNSFSIDQIMLTMPRTVDRMAHVVFVVVFVRLLGLFDCTCAHVVLMGLRVATYACFEGCCWGSCFGYKTDQLFEH